MVGILNQPFLSLDRHFDIAALQKLELEIMEGLARCHWNLATYGPSVTDPEIDHELTEIETLADLGKDLNPEIVARAKTIEDRDARRRFLKLATRCFVPAYTVHLRRHFGSHGARSFSESSTPTENQKHFPGLMKFIETLPFSEIGRVLFFIHEHNCKIPIHRDGTTYKPHKHEFLYIRTNLSSKFYILDEVKNEKHFVQSHISYFNERDFHGGDPSPHMTFSLRIDGVFTPEFRRLIGTADIEEYAASNP